MLADAMNEPLSEEQIHALAQDLVRRWVDSLTAFGTADERVLFSILEGPGVLGCPAAYIPMVQDHARLAIALRQELSLTKEGLTPRKVQALLRYRGDSLMRRMFPTDPPQAPQSSS